MMSAWGSACWPGGATDCLTSCATSWARPSCFRSGGPGQLRRGRPGPPATGRVVALAALALPHLRPPAECRRADPGDQLPGSARPLPGLRYPDRSFRADPRRDQWADPGRPLGRHRLRASRVRAGHWDRLTDGDLGRVGLAGTPGLDGAPQKQLSPQPRVT